MTRSRTRAKKQRMHNLAAMLKPCMNCGEAGPHYVPPSLGERGFFICKPSAGVAAQSHQSAKNENTTK